MMKIRRKAAHLFAWALILLLILVLAACGKDTGELEKLRQENSSLQEQVSALEEELTALQKQIGEPEGGVDDLEMNPIDSFYDTVEADGSTVSMNLVSGSWEAAWRAETRHLAEELKSQLPLQEDRDLVDAYLAAAEAQIGRMDIMAIYQISDLTVPQEERAASSGTLRGVMWAGSRARIWRDTFWQLHFVLPEVEYTFLFDAAAAQQELEDSLNEN